MAGKISRTGYNDTSNTEQWVLNNSIDRDFNQLATELLGYDPLTKNTAGEIVGGLKRITTKSVGEYVANDIEESGTITPPCLNIGPYVMIFDDALNPLYKLSKDLYLRL